jgi:prepilin-type N-terminal cleavage/methylation domain-containing protein
MSRLRKRAARLIASQSGFTLVELLFASMLGLIVIATGVTVFTATIRSQPGQTQRGVSIQQARNVMERMTREIRQGSTVYPSTSSQLSLITLVHSASCGGAAANTAIPCKVTYTCNAGSCTRVEAPPPPATGSGPTVTTVSGLSASDVFRYTPACNATSTSGSPGYVCITLTFQTASGADAITVQDGAAPVNPTSS